MLIPNSTERTIFLLEGASPIGNGCAHNVTPTAWPHLERLRYAWSLEQMEPNVHGRILLLIK